MNRLKKLRQEKKLSQKELAEILSVHYRTLQNQENGESQIKPEKAQQLADYFGVSVGYLLGYEEIPDLLLDEIANDLNRRLTKDEKEDLENHPELTEYYLDLAWERMLKNGNEKVEKQVRAFDDDFIDFLKYHDLYLSNTEIEKVINIMYSYSNTNDLYLSSLIKNKDFKELQKQKEKDFSKLFEYSTLWKINLDGAMTQAKKD